MARGVDQRRPDPGRVRRLEAAVAAAGVDRMQLRGLSRLTERAAEAADTRRRTDGVLPIAPELAALTPWPGLRRGITMTVGPGGASVLAALLTAGTAGGQWAAAVGLPDLGMVLADEFGATLERLALVPRPGEAWASATAHLIEGTALVVVAPPEDARPQELARLGQRARERDTVLVLAAVRSPARLGVDRRPPRWEQESRAELRWSVTGRQVAGVGWGYGRVHRQTVTITATGRGAAARPRTAEVAMPPKAPALLPATAGSDRRRVAG